MMNRRHFFKLASAAWPALFLPKLIKPVWKRIQPITPLVTTINVSLWDGVEYTARYTMTPSGFWRREILNPPPDHPLARNPPLLLMPPNNKPGDIEFSLVQGVLERKDVHTGNECFLMREYSPEFRQSGIHSKSCWGVHVEPYVAHVQGGEL